MVPPSQMKSINGDIFVFKEDIKPDWEDEKNKDGGAWYINPPGRNVDIDRWWLNLVKMF